MMKYLAFLPLVGAILIFSSCSVKAQREVEIYQTSAAGDKLAPKTAYEAETENIVELKPEERFQEITGFGGAFTESSAHLLQHLSDSLREEVVASYFGDEGSQYSLCRTHINSCDFSLDHYAYVEEGDTALQTFSLDEDRDDVIPMIKLAQQKSSGGFRIVASPWTAPPWMKDNNEWEGGKLLPKYYDTWARYFAKYLEAYHEEGIDMWGVTVENEPLGNSAQWESMHYTPAEMADFVKNHLGPQLQATFPETRVLVYDQNKGEELEEWAGHLLQDTALLPYIYGTAVHWYTGTKDWFPESLQYTHQLAPEKHIVHTEACVDAEVPKWKQDDWYWKEEATDWGYQWAAEENKHKHPKYVPVYRYARDIIGSLNNWVEGWIDWNMVLDKQGGPNWAENWCVAPVIADTTADEVYYTPLYYTLAHFSKFIRPGATRIGFSSDNEDLMLTAVENPDQSVVVTALNMTGEKIPFTIKLEGEQYPVAADAQSLLTVKLKPKGKE